MPLYNSGLAPAVPDQGGKKEGLLTNNTGQTPDETIAALPAAQATPSGATQAELDAIEQNISDLAAKINALITHLNNGRT